MNHAKKIETGIKPEQQKPITERIKTLDDVYSILNIEKETAVPYPQPSNDDEKWLNAAQNLSYIAKALNEGWTPDWTNGNEYKYYPWFDLSKGASGFSYNGYFYWNSDTRLPPPAFASKTRNLRNSPAHSLSKFIGNTLKDNNMDDKINTSKVNGFNKISIVSSELIKTVENVIAKTDRDAHFIATYTSKTLFEAANTDTIPELNKKALKN